MTGPGVARLAGSAVPAELELLVAGSYATPGLPRGEFWATRLDDGGIVIDRADPRILISGELLHRLAAGDLHPGVYLDSRHLPPAEDEPVRPELFAGVLLKVRAANRNVVYRITEYVAEANAYIGEWPE